MLITACVNSLICVNFLNIIFCDYNYYILQEKDELLEARRRKLSPLTSYDAQKRLDHCSERGEPVTLQFQKNEKVKAQATGSGSRTARSRSKEDKRRKVEQAKSTERIGWIVGQTEASVDSLEKMRFRMMRKMRA
ncbi:hypothetical protein T10_2849 [Trichinella papuae]|uniref:Uncharacterized protein n=1 Tax=Trichinella papuae TaxID=268474 RepID=A0A0V1M685_9BILA|nr:hypothetical protein T10_2849 [Trichinella papuae]